MDYSGVGELLLLKLPNNISRTTKLLILENLDVCCSVRPNNAKTGKETSICSVTEYTQTEALCMCIDMILSLLPACAIIATAQDSSSLAQALLLPQRLSCVLPLQELNHDDRIKLLSRSLIGFEVKGISNDVGSRAHFIRDLSTSCQVCASTYLLLIQVSMIMHFTYNRE